MDDHVHPRRDAPEDQAVSARISSESPNVIPVCPAAPWTPVRPAQPQPQRGDGDDQARQRPRHGDVEERVAIPSGRAHPDHRPEGAEQEQGRRRRDEVRRAHRGPVRLRGEVMAELVRPEDGEQRGRERQAGEQPERRAQRVEGQERNRSGREETPRGEGRKSVSRKSAILTQRRERSATTASGTARNQVPALSRLRKGVYP